MLYHYSSNKIENNLIECNISLFKLTFLNQQKHTPHMNIKNIPLISATALNNAIHENSEIAIIDVREDGEFGENHLLFATPLPYSRLEIGIQSLIPRKNAHIVLCDDGKSALAECAAMRLNQLGYSQIEILEGGTTGWKNAGYQLFKGVNVPSKLFGELVEHAYDTPRITADELVQLQKSGEDFVLFDGRPVNEHQKMTIPGSICIPNAELPYRVPTIVKNPNTKIIVNCAGRTRSILGAQTLINFGIPNPTFALENGTQGWFLADYPLEYGANRRYSDTVDATLLPKQKKAAESLMHRFEIKTIDTNTINDWQKETNRTTYFCDVRTPEEFAENHIPGSQNCPGGQLIQATDQWVGIRGSRIVLIDSGEMVRAPVVASWLYQLGHEVYVLQNGIKSTLKIKELEPIKLPKFPLISSKQLSINLSQNDCIIFEIRSSMEYRNAHIPGSQWSWRTRIITDVKNSLIAKNINNELIPIILVADQILLAELVALDLQNAQITNIKILDGGFQSWTHEGYPTESTSEYPSDNDCVDYLFFVHDRHAGNREAMKAYLSWETGLMAQMTDDEKKLFRIPQS